MNTPTNTNNQLERDLAVTLFADLMNASRPTSEEYNTPGLADARAKASAKKAIALAVFFIGELDRELPDLEEAEDYADTPPQLTEKDNHQSKVKITKK